MVLHWLQKKYSINFTENKIKFSLSYETNSYILVNGTGIINFKAKDSEVAVTALCLGNILIEVSIDNMKNIGLNWYV